MSADTLTGAVGRLSRRRWFHLPRSSGRIEHRIHNPEVAGSSPAGRGVADIGVASFQGCVNR